MCTALYVIKTSAGDMQLWELKDDSLKKQYNNGCIGPISTDTSEDITEATRESNVRFTEGN